MNPIRTMSFAIIPVAATAACAVPSLVGDTVQRVQHAQLTGEIVTNDFAIVADPGPEFIDSSVFLGGEWRRFDLGPTSIRMETSQYWYSPWFDSGFLPTYAEFRDLDFGEPGWTIGGVNVTWGGSIGVESGAPLNYPAFGPNAVSFNADTVRLYTGPFEFGPGSWVQIDLILVPAPASTALLSIGLIAARRRR